jgi:hypothetical protein
MTINSERRRNGDLRRCARLRIAEPNVATTG